MVGVALCLPTTMSLNATRLGNKIGYSYSPGFPHMRLINGKKFADMHGFALIHKVFQTEYWPGSDVLRSLLKLMEIPEVRYTL